VELGCEHEQQHQELILTDAKHALCAAPAAEPERELDPLCAGQARAQLQERFVAHAGGLCEIGAGTEGFAFDNERPRHRVWLEPFALATRCVTNAQWLEFIEEGGYADPANWLSDGWALVQAERWQAPLYWVRRARGFVQRSFAGHDALDPLAPVCHVSFYEADAYARFRARRDPGLRLPSEAEWELVAAKQPVAGNFADGGALQPLPASHAQERVVQQLFGDVWEWTASPYLAYPRFTPLAGALSEYNGKFMCNQLVLRGGSCFSPQEHLRASYRNYFAPSARWQMSGVRLARFT